MEENSKFTLGEQSAKEVYAENTGARTGMLSEARLMAELTIPSVMPPEGYKTGDKLPGNNQSIGTSCVNHLSSALAFMAFPPGQPIAKINSIDYEFQDEIDQDPELWSRIQLALAQAEIAHRKHIAATPLQAAYTGYIKLLMVAGNALWKHIYQPTPTFHRPDSYIVKRNSLGEQLLVIHDETVSLQGMEPHFREQVETIIKSNETALSEKDKQEWNRTASIQSVCKLNVEDGEKTWLYWQECEGEMLEGSEVEVDFEYPPMWAGWLIPNYGDDWGTSYCAEYRGDLFTVENHMSALNDGAAMAALNLLFVKPGSQTSIKQVREAQNLSVLSGDAEDLSTLKTHKGADMNFVSTTLESAARRLNRAFLLQAGIQRSGERVTAEEVRRLGMELDRGMGGLYTQISQGNQRVIIKRAFRLNEEAHKNLPPLPEDKVDIQVITGTDAMGNSIEIDNLTEWAAMNKQAYPVSFEKATNGLEFHRRTAAAKGIKPDGLIKSPEEIQAQEEADQNQMMQQQLLDKGTGPAVQGIAAAMQNQQQGA